MSTKRCSRDRRGCTAHRCADPICGVRRLAGPTWELRVPMVQATRGNPFGAGFAACLAAANLFRFLFLPDGKSLLDEDVGFPPDAASLPYLTAAESSDPLVLVGVGAIGNSAAWALSRTPLGGKIWLIDPESVELSNLQRYVLCARSDEGGVKVEIARKAFRRAASADSLPRKLGLLRRGAWLQVGASSGRARLRPRQASSAGKPPTSGCKRLDSSWRPRSVLPRLLGSRCVSRMSIPAN